MVAHSMFYFRLPYRQMEGLLRTYNSNNCNCKGIFPMIPDYTSIHRRICRLQEEIRCQRRRTGNNVILATGSTGISVANCGQQMRNKWGKKNGHTQSRGFPRIHVASDMHTGEVLALRITDDRIPDCRCLGVPCRITPNFRQNMQNS